jgi:Glu-tRNA(Gln) amidotransferase subunit E-like FAD-binding protein
MNTTNSNVVEVVNAVKTKQMAEEVVAELLKTYSTNEAWKNLATEAKFQKQSPRETVRRVVSNLFTSFRTYK